MGSDFVNWDRKEGKKHFQIWLILVIRSMAEASCAQGTCLIPAKPACHPYYFKKHSNILLHALTLFFNQLVLLRIYFHTIFQVNKFQRRAKGIRLCARPPLHMFANTYATNAWNMVSYFPSVSVLNIKRSYWQILFLFKYCKIEFFT